MNTLVPRLELADMTQGLQNALAARVARLGYLGEFFKCAANEPDSLLAFMAFTDALKRALPDKLTEVVALTVATRLDNAYERHQHERLALTLGYGQRWISDVIRCDPASSSELSEDEHAVQALTLALVDQQGDGAGEPFQRVVRQVGPSKASALLLLVGRYVTHAFYVKTMALPPPVGSIFETSGK